MDLYRREQALDWLDLLKVDAEGLDLSVLVGAPEMLRAGRTRFIQFVLNLATMYTRTYLRDFWRILGLQYQLSRNLCTGVAECPRDTPAGEVFLASNFLAELAG